MQISANFRSPWALVALLLIATARLSAAEPKSTPEFYLRPGDRVVFYGDSITAQGHYAAAVESYVAACRPDLDVTFINSGWSGDRAWGGDGGMLEERLQRDVVAHQATVVAVMLGMNDAYYANYDPKAREAFEASIEKLIDILQRDLPGVRVTLLGASPYDNISPGEQPEWEQNIEGGYNSVVRRFSEAMGDVARRRELLFVDMNLPLVQLLERCHKINPTLAAQIIPDRIHPGYAAGLVMAVELLDAWHAPSTGSELVIDAKTAVVVSAVGTSASDCATTGGLRWTQRDAALPFPVDRTCPVAVLALKGSPRLASRCRQRIRIANSGGKDAALSINGQRVGVYSAAEWSEGVDLAPMPTPAGQQASLVAHYAALRQQLLRILTKRLAPHTVGEPLAETDAAIAELAAMKRDLMSVQQAATQILPMRFEICESLGP